MVTVTNYGYRLYTLNVLKSLAPFGLDKKVLVICMDQRSHCLFDERGYRTLCMDQSLSAFCAWNTKGYDIICYLKLEVLYRILSASYHVVLVDGDIVFLTNPLPDIESWEQNTNSDVWIQNDAQHDRDTSNLCTGYLFIRSHPGMITLYDCLSKEGREQYARCAFDNNDQSYFNRYVKPHCRVQALPLENYPNGRVWYDKADTLRNTATLVHFNWVHGHMKMAKMKEHKLWLLTDDEEV